MFANCKLSWDGGIDDEEQIGERQVGLHPYIFDDIEKTWRYLTFTIERN